MSATKKRRRRSDGIATRARVLRVATTLFAAGGYEATSLRQIAAASEIDIATLKYHFQDKANLFARVYEKGHAAFLEEMATTLDDLERAQSVEQVREAIATFCRDMHDFVEENLDFVKMTLFRMLEESVEVILIEEDLQTIALAVLEQRFDKLVERGVILPVDARALAVFLISSFLCWHVTTRIKSAWLGPPHIETEAGRARSEAFFISSVDRILGIDPTGALS